MSKNIDSSMLTTEVNFLRAGSSSSVSLNGYVLLISVAFLVGALFFHYQQSSVKPVISDIQTQALHGAIQDNAEPEWLIEYRRHAELSAFYAGLLAQLNRYKDDVQAANAHFDIDTSQAELLLLAPDQQALINSYAQLAAYQPEQNHYEITTQGMRLNKVAEGWRLNAKLAITLDRERSND